MKEVQDHLQCISYPEDQHCVNDPAFFSVPCLLDFGRMVHSAEIPPTQNLNNRMKLDETGKNISFSRIFRWQWFEKQFNVPILKIYVLFHSAISAPVTKE